MIKETKYSGFIYKRTLIAPSSQGSSDYGKSYIGQTDNLEERNYSWEKANNRNYAGMKISDAREKYGVTSSAWKTDVLETVYADTKEELKEKLNDRETANIYKYDSVENGFNGSYGNGMKGMKHTNKSKAMISANHRNCQTEDTKKKISESNKGRKHTEETKRKISKANTGKKRTNEQRRKESDSRKGKEPVAASKALKAYIDKNGHGPTKGIKQSIIGRANMKAAQQKRGTKIRALYPDGSTKEFTTMLDAAKACSMNVGSVASVIKTNGVCRNGMKFERIV